MLSFSLSLPRVRRVVWQTRTDAIPASLLTGDARRPLRILAVSATRLDIALLGRGERDWTADALAATMTLSGGGAALFTGRLADAAKAPRSGKRQFALDAAVGTAIRAVTGALTFELAGEAAIAADPGDVSTGAPRALAETTPFGAGAEYREAAIGLAPAARIVTCIEIAHPAAAAPIRLVDDGEDAVIGGVAYRAARFEAVTAGDGGERAPRGQVAIGNVGREVSRWIEDADGGAGGQARVFEALVRDGAGALEWELTMDIASISVEDNVVLGLGFDPLLGRPAVAMRYDPQTAPGLF